MPGTRDNVFNRVSTDFSVRGVTRVEWSLRPRFCERPHIFQLQVSRNGGVDWEDVGEPITDIYHAFDDERRLCGGMDQSIVYRVQLLTGEGRTFYSGHSTILGNLTTRQWLQAREVIRRCSLASRQLNVLSGWLYKRRLQGQVCTLCVDPYTGGITNSDCPNCQGTGFVDGYWLAATDNMIDLSPELRHLRQDQNRGTVDDQVAMGRFIGLPMINSRDIWIDKAGDQRYYVHRVQHKAEMNQVVLVADVELKLADHADILYTIEVPDA